MRNPAMGSGLVIVGQLSVYHRASRNQWRYLLRGKINQQLAILYFSLDYNINYQKLSRHRLIFAIHSKAWTVSFLIRFEVLQLKPCPLPYFGTSHFFQFLSVLLKSLHTFWI